MGQWAESILYVSDKIDDDSLADFQFQKAKIKFPSNYYIEENSAGLPNTEAERFEYIAYMATTNSNLAKNYWTYAIADFTFELSWADITGQSGSKVYTAYKELGYYNNFD